MKKFTLSSGSTIEKPFNKVWVVLGILTLLIVIFSFFITFEPSTVNLSELGVIIKKMFSPKAGRTWGDYFGFINQLWEPLISTLEMSLAGTVIGSLFAVPIAILAAKNIFKSRFVYVPIRFFMNLVRTVPAMLLAVLAVYFVGIGVLSGVIAITIFTFGIMSKMLYEVIETVDMNPYEALESTGASKVQAFRYAVFPQVFPVFLSYLIYIFEINVRASAILGYVGAGGIGSVIKDNVLYNYDRVGATLIVMLVVILVVQFFSDFLIGRGVYAFEEGVIYLTIETLAIGFLGTLVGAILALPFSFLASKNIVGIKVAKIGEAILVMIRVFPEVILALVIVKGFGMNALTGMLTIGIHSIGMLGKLFSETIDNMDKSSLEALEAVGATTITKIRYGIMPQIMADLSSITLYRLDINVRSATVLGIVGAGGLGASMILSAENSNWDILGTIMVAIIVMVLTVDAISSHLRSKLV